VTVGLYLYVGTYVNDWSAAMATAARDHESPANLEDLTSARSPRVDARSPGFFTG
jgi:hypothetical protein